MYEISLEVCGTFALNVKKQRGDIKKVQCTIKKVELKNSMLLLHCCTVYAKIPNEYLTMFIRAWERCFC